MKPVIIVPCGIMSAKDIAKLCDNDFCVVEAKDPARVKFIDPIPCQSSRTQIEEAAIKLSRIMVNGDWRRYWNGDNVTQVGAAHILVQLLMNDTPLDSRGTKQEQEQREYDNAKFDEVRKIAREDARAEAKKIKEAKETAAKIATAEEMK